MPKPSRTYTSWDTNDLAFLIYADYKGVSRQLVAEIFGVSAQSISQQMMKIRNPHTYSKATQEKLNKAGVLEMKVRSGAYPDHRKIWDEKLTKVTGITYDYPETPAELEENDQEEVMEDESSEEIKHPPLLQLTISTEAVLKIIKAWGKAK